MAEQLINTLHDIITHATAEGVAQLSTEDEALDGRTLTLKGRRLVNFGSCSYLGLEHHPALAAGAMEALRRYGTQFSSSRTYASLGLYEVLESNLEQIFGQPVIATPSTTLGHMSALPVLVGDQDAVIVDMQVHSSVQMAAQLLKARGIPLSVIRHNDMDALERRVRQLKVTHRRIWYLADGVYSMYGDFAPLEQLQSLLQEHPQLHLYIDDAHGMSWSGEHGCGLVRSRMPHHPRMVQAVSLNKAFGAAGGALVFPDRALAQRVRNCGGTMIFSGPIQPPMLGAAVASARLHLSPEIEVRQARLAALVRRMNHRLEEVGLPQMEPNEGPLFFIPSGMMKLNINLFKRMAQEGYYINTASFPAVPMKRGGLRLTVTAHLELADVDGLVDALAYHYPRALDEEGYTPEGVAKTFGLPEPRFPRLDNVQPLRGPAPLQAEVRGSIQERSTPGPGTAASPTAAP
jgi:7-keto-8-aminopelargonate synthetase-like enzyme